ncbi:uncharacterized protein LOC141799925 [Halichoeres trimaculatus]|uniref:uncharacterized protein LOC141799925 n=1 Tax=Halichoeres trimaculatus TaxID=147232 RepID=UPI003D9E5807
MRLQQTLICFFLLSLRDGRAAFFEKDIGVRTGAEGGDIRVGCTFTFSGSRKTFCRGDCEDGDILVETSGVSNQSGRYSIEYIKESFASFPLIYVSITNLRKSDSGRYSCELGREWAPDGSLTFELQVTDAPTTTKPNWTPRRFSASTSTTIRTTWTHRSTSVSPTNSTASPKTTNGSEKQPLASDPGPLLYLSLLLVLLIVIFSVILLIYCKRRARKPKAEAAGSPIKTEYADISGTNRIYEEIREDELNRSPPRDISTVYTCAKFTKTYDVQTTDEYSLAGPQTEDDSSKLPYSMIDFSNSPAAPHNSAPSGGVIYSVPRADASPEDALYSTYLLMTCFTAPTTTTTKPNWTTQRVSASTLSIFVMKTTPPAAPASASPFYVRLVLVILIILSSSALLIFCTRKRRSQAEDPHVELDYVNVTEGHQVYEEVGEEQRQGRSPPEETS